MKQFVSILAGMAIVWTVYGMVPITGNYIIHKQQHRHLDPYILYFLSLGRIVGSLLCLPFTRPLEQEQYTFKLYDLTTVTIPQVSMIGWICYFMLLSYGNISLIAPLVSLYILIPIIVSARMHGKKFTKVQLASICMSLSASVLFAIVVNTTSNMSVWLQVLCFFGVFISWSYIDTRSATFNLKHPEPERKVLVLALVGHVINNLILSFAIAVSGNGSGNSTNSSGTIDFLDYLPFWLSNMAMPLGWLCYIKVAKVDVTISMPLYSLSSVFPLTWGLAVMHDPISNLKIAGICLTIVSFTLMMLPEYVKSRKGPEPGLESESEPELDPGPETGSGPEPESDPGPDPGPSLDLSETDDIGLLVSKV